MMRSKVAVELHLLPHDVLRDILSRLSLKQAVRMSLLSCEWRRLGICPLDLVFTEETLFGSNTTTIADPEYMVAEFLESRNIEFITRVDSVLRTSWSTSTMTTASTVNKFVVKYGLGTYHRHHIDRWIDFSTALMAKHIRLDLRGDGFAGGIYVVPLCKLSGPNGSCVKSLDLAYVCLCLPASFCGITNLNKLSLYMVSIDARDLERLLLSCLLLKSLSLECCPLSSFTIRQEICRLQYLSVRKCAVRMIQLQAPNLTTFKFDDCVTQIVLRESSKLSEATIVFKNMRDNSCSHAFNYILTELPTSLPYVQKLFLHLVIDYQVKKFSKTHTTFINLWHLNLNIDVRDDPEDASWVIGLVYLLESAPLLEELELNINYDRFVDRDPTRIVKAVPGPLHRHLRSVHITGFCDLVGIAELSLYILGNAIVLERMVVDPVVWMDNGYPYSRQLYSVSKVGSYQESARPRFTKQELRDREFAKQHLNRKEFQHMLTIL
ncbi:unnamed protein product [Triticum turgidum subsp. durum]|uniref:F-box domain-containing protein n=1 Tax=Triticum turgidum subsp. durum TaxID=4567 RepID=A0A9R1Q3K5_TRITD|nr:unnamed protein product [Triticum turgidum subsp. durum]